MATRYLDSNGVIWGITTEPTSATIAPVGPGFAPVPQNTLFGRMAQDSAKKYEPPPDDMSADLQVGDRGVSIADATRSVEFLIEQYAKAHAGDVRGPEAEASSGGWGWLLLLAVGGYAWSKRRKR